MIRFCIVVMAALVALAGWGIGTRRRKSPGRRFTHLYHIRFLIEGKQIYGSESSWPSKHWRK
jgi:hypothetical protein